MSISRLRHPVVLIGVTLITAHVALFAIHRKVTAVGRYQREHVLVSGQQSDKAPAYDPSVGVSPALCQVATAASSLPKGAAQPAAPQTAQHGHELVVDYYEAATTVYNDGHAIHLDVAPGSTLSLDGKAYQLERIDLRAVHPGRDGDMIAHLVHKGNDGKLLVLSLLLHPGQTNNTLGSLLKFLPPKAGEHNALWDVRINPTALLPTRLDYYAYRRAPTRLGCADKVQWLALERPAELSPRQLAAYHRVLEGKAAPLPMAGRTAPASARVQG